MQLRTKARPAVAVLRDDQYLLKRLVKRKRKLNSTIKQEKYRLEHHDEGDPIADIHAPLTMLEKKCAALTEKIEAHIAGGRDHVMQCLNSAVMAACRFNPDIHGHYERKIARPC